MTSGACSIGAGSAGLLIGCCVDLPVHAVLYIERVMPYLSMGRWPILSQYLGTAPRSSRCYRDER